MAKNMLVWKQNIKSQPQAVQAEYESYFMWFHIA